ncbi:hypothetical protein FDENT_4247 [Fusarium denticulatum]|uniref:Uncharacterized protein n=1 Tax=Fusarium denticulatum TaxID=48507 RepID=A0A8H5UFV4_9HYPO|nr:hypothetical protein FDENT_4247 [Fusarium denticulatum]
MYSSLAAVIPAISDLALTLDCSFDGVSRVCLWASVFPYRQKIPLEHLFAILFGIVEVEIVFCTDDRWRTGHNGLGCEPKVLGMEPDATWLDAIVAYWYFPTAMLES